MWERQDKTITSCICYMNLAVESLPFRQAKRPFGLFCLAQLQPLCAANQRGTFWPLPAPCYDFLVPVCGEDHAASSLLIRAGAGGRRYAVGGSSSDRCACGACTRYGRPDETHHYPTRDSSQPADSPQLGSSRASAPIQSSGHPPSAGRAIQPGAQQRSRAVYYRARDTGGRPHGGTGYPVTSGAGAGSIFEDLI